MSNTRKGPESDPERDFEGTFPVYVDPASLPPKPKRQLTPQQQSKRAEILARRWHYQSMMPAAIHASPEELARGKAYIREVREALKTGSLDVANAAGHEAVDGVVEVDYLSAPEQLQMPLEDI